MSISREQIQNQLKEFSFFGALDDRGINALSAIVRAESFEEGDHIITQGAAVNGVYIILDGDIKVTLETEAGAIVVLDEIQSGSVFGTLSAIDRKNRGANCIAQRKSTVGRIAMLDFQDLMYGSSALALGFQIVILRSIFQEIRRTNEQLSELSSLPPLYIV